MRIKKCEGHSVPKPEYYRWRGTDLPVFKCPECGWLAQSEIASEITHRLSPRAEPKSYEEAAKLVLRTIL